MADHIKITDVTPRIQYVANGAQTTFTYPFAIFQASDLEVFESDTVQTLDTHYTVSSAGESEGGSITFLTAPANATVITLRRRLVVQRTSDFQESGSLRAKTLNDEFDYQTAVLQQLGDDQARSLRLAATDAGTLGTLPTETVRAGKILAFDADGNPIVSDGSSGGVVISATMTPVVQAATLAAGRTGLGLEIGADVQAYDADTLKADTTDTLTAGYSVTPYDAGTKSGGTFTPAAADGNVQYATNNGAHTLAPPVTDCSIDILYTNGASAGAITTSGFDWMSGAFTTTDTEKFRAEIRRVNNFTSLNIVALQ